MEVMYRELVIIVDLVSGRSTLSILFEQKKMTISGQAAYTIRRGEKQLNVIGRRVEQLN